jgi:hypothetical protein
MTPPPFIAFTYSNELACGGGDDGVSILSH